MTVDPFLHGMADFIGDDSLTREYGKSWILRDRETARVLDIGYVVVLRCKLWQ